MKIRPVQDRIVVRRVAEEEKTKGGSSFPTRPRKSREGEVVAVGPGKANDKAWFVRSK